MSYQNAINATQLSSANIIVYTSSGSYVVPADLKSLQVECFGGGGGSGAAAQTAAGQGSASGGGGAGAYTKSVYAASALTSPVTVTVGARGLGGINGGADGQNGGTSSFHVDSAGGGSGTPNSLASAGSVESAGGAGGIASGAQLNVNGLSGLVGASYGTTPRVLTNVARMPGQYGVTYQAGGTNICNDVSTFGENGKNGSFGVVLLTEFRGGP
jgi:hypothetical protein